MNSFGLILFAGLLCVVVAEPPRRNFRFFARQEAAPSADAGKPYPPAEAAPYPPSGTKPNGRLLELPARQETYRPPATSYGTPAETYGAPTSEAPEESTTEESTESATEIEPESEQINVPNAQQVAANSANQPTNFYFIQYPDSPFQRIVYVAAPVGSAPAVANARLQVQPVVDSQQVFLAPFVSAAPEPKAISFSSQYVQHNSW